MLEAHQPFSKTSLPFLGAALGWRQAGRAQRPSRCPPHSGATHVPIAKRVADRTGGPRPPVTATGYRAAAVQPPDGLAPPLSCPTPLCGQPHSSCQGQGGLWQRAQAWQQTVLPSVRWSIRSFISLYFGSLVCKMSTTAVTPQGHWSPWEGGVLMNRDLCLPEMTAH